MLLCCFARVALRAVVLVALLPVPPVLQRSSLHLQGVTVRQDVGVVEKEQKS
jgi:hypothetical protein